MSTTPLKVQRPLPSFLALANPKALFSCRDLYKVFGFKTPNTMYQSSSKGHFPAPTTIYKSDSWNTNGFHTPRAMWDRVAITKEYKRRIAEEDKK